MKSLQKPRAWLLAVLLALVGSMLTVVPAQAYGPSVLVSPSGSCTRPYCFTYAKSVQLPSGRLVATYEDNNQPLENMTFPIWTSTDNGASWARTSSVADTSPRRWGNWTNPHLYVLPQQIGTMPAGTLLLAGISSPPDRSATAVQLYRSNNEGQTWSWVSEVALGGGQWGSANPTPIWEPYMLVANNRLIVYYSDERDKADHDQKIVHQTSTNGVNWGPVVEDVAMADRALRPGMPIVTRMANGQYLMVFEMVGQSNTPNNFKISANPESWNSGNGGTTIDHGGSPMVITLPNGRLVYNSYGSTDVRVNTNNGAGAWTPMRTLMPQGYSRMLQYVAGTGRVLILSVDGFWTDTPNTVRYGDVDLGHSAGPYYKLVNRRSGKALDAYQADLRDGANLVQWADNGGANQHWHVTDVGGGYRTLFNRNSGRVLSVWETSTADGARAVQWVENYGGDQQWQLVPVGSYYKIVARHSGKVLSVLGGSTADGAQVVQWADTGSLDQQWQLVQI
ncbi:RICIN domain-containing protein [Saccharothrix deserti]|uniref:RICIN domain-containing protein n=1 Tax=Saccharothrix deserti TaxID=2593674 RepID=UPI00131CABCF|nr:RICIN domain-containing protein [Saccharothrix deserti]